MTSAEEEPIIFKYAAEQAMADGLLIEVDPPLRKEAGYRRPVRITIGVASLVTPEEEEVDAGQSLNGRLWDTLHMARIAINNADRRDIVVPFEVNLGGQTATLWACLDTTSEPAIHIIRPEEY